MLSKVSAQDHGMLIPKGYSNYKDPKNPGKLISLDSVKATNDCLIEAMTKKEKGSEAYRRVMHETDGDREQARAASDKEDGGGMCKMWDDLCKQGHVICLVVKSPSAGDIEEMQKMEQFLKMLIYKIDKHLFNQIVDIYTSRKEIGTVGETTVMCRWPIYLGIPVQNLAATLNITAVGSHQFKAWTSFEGRSKVPRAAPVDQWSNVTIGGRKVAELTADELNNNNWNPLPSDTIKQNLEESHQAIVNASMFVKDEAKENAEMEDSIWPHEIEGLMNMKTWAYAQEIIHGGKVQGMAMFRMAGEVIKACADMPKATSCVVLDGFGAFYPETELFLNNGTGNYFVTFDPPFVLRMGGNGTNLKEDGPPGEKSIIAYYCIQYNMSEDHQMQILTAGIVFAQHVQVNTNRLSALAFRMQEQLTELSCSVAAGSAEFQQKVHFTAPKLPRVLLPHGLSASCTSSVADGQDSLADDLGFTMVEQGLGAPNE